MTCGHTFVRGAKSSRVGGILSCLVLFMLILFGLLNANQMFLLNIHSDMLYLVSLYQDLFVYHNTLTGWNLTPAPYFFPDMPLFFPMLALTPDIGYGFTLYSLIFSGCLLLVLTTISTGLSIKPVTAALVILSGFSFLVALCQNQDYARLFSFFFYPSFHSGAILGGLLLLALTVKVVKAGPSFLKYFTIFTLSLFLTISDMLIIPQFLLPLTLAMLFYSLADRSTFHTSLTYAAVTTAAMCSAFLLLAAFSLLDLFTIPPVMAELSLNPREIPAKLALFLVDLQFYAVTYRVLAGIFAAWILASFLLFLTTMYSALGKTKNNERNEARPLIFLIIFSFLSIGGCLAAPVTVNRWEPWCFSYIQPVFVMPLFLLLLFAGFLDRYKYIFQLLVLAAGVYSLSQIAPGIANLNADHLRLPYPKPIQRLDEIADAFDLHYGYSDYWAAKYVTAFSRRGLRVNQIKQDWDIDLWINNIAWYFTDSGNRKYPQYDFILFTPPLRPEIEKKFGPPAFNEYVGGREISVYNRKRDVAFRNFLRVPALMAADAEMPLSPHIPEALGSYAPNGTTWNSPGAITIPEGEELVVLFQKKVSGEVLEIAADGNDRYEVLFFNDQMQVGDKVFVQNAVATNLQVRYLLLPDSFHSNSFNRLLIRPVEGDGQHSIGHIFLYEDSYSS